MILFVVAEAGAARYFLPLWQLWLDQPPGVAWHVILGDGAAGQLDREPIRRRLPILATLDRRSDEVAAVVADMPVGLVVASAGDRVPLERAGVALARRRKVRAIQVIDTWYNYARRFDEARPNEIPDAIGVIDEAALAEAAAEGLPVGKLCVVGQPWFERACDAVSSAPLAKVLLLGAPIRRDFGDVLGYDEESIVEMVLGAMDKAPHLFAQVWYGPHPEQAAVPEKVARRMEVVDSGEEILKQAGTVIGAFSAPMIEAFLSSARVISAQPGSHERDMCPLSRHGLVPRARDADELVGYMQRPFVADTEQMCRSLSGSVARLGDWVLENKGA